MNVVEESLNYFINKLRIIPIGSIEDILSGGILTNPLKLLTILPFELQLNPEQYERSVQISYNDPRTLGSVGSPLQHHKNEPEQFSLRFLLDGTGVVPPSITNPVSLGFSALFSAAGVVDLTYVTRRIFEFRAITEKFQGGQHRPNRVLILWGDVDAFMGVLTGLKVTHTLFHPSGAPLRAEVEATFKQDGIKIVEEALKRLSSPDLTHVRTPDDSNKLWLMCYDIYKSPDWYIEAARVNSLTHFRRLRTDRTLFFPPLEKNVKQNAPAT